MFRVQAVWHGFGLRHKSSGLWDYQIVGVRASCVISQHIGFRVWGLGIALSRNGGP